MSDTKLKPCPACGGSAARTSSTNSYTTCADPHCYVCGPSGDSDGSKWNAMPRREDATGKQSLQVDDKREERRFRAACAAEDADILYWLEILRLALRNKDKFGGPTRIDARIAFADALLAELDGRVHNAHAGIHATVDGV